MTYVCPLVSDLVTSVSQSGFSSTLMKETQTNIIKKYLNIHVSGKIKKINNTGKNVTNHFIFKLINCLSHVSQTDATGIHNWINLDNSTINKYPSTCTYSITSSTFTKIRHTHSISLNIKQKIISVWGHKISLNHTHSRRNDSSIEWIQSSFTLMVWRGWWQAADAGEVIIIISSDVDPGVKIKSSIA